MNKTVIKNWENSQLPGIDCILKSDGTMIVLNAYKTENNDYFFFPICDTTIESIIKYNEDIWSGFQTFVKIDSEQGIYYAGEGSMGNEGFIAHCDLSGNFRWAIYLTNSNPFYKLELNGNTLSAFSSYDIEYKVNTINPEHIEITSSDWRNDNKI